MKFKFSPTIGRTLAILSLTILTTVVAKAVDYSTVTSDFFTAYPDQAEFPIILLQPLNQVLPVGSDATFSVAAMGDPLTYQWLRNGVALAGETNNSLTITNVKVADVGLYSCNISKDLEIVPTRSAQLMVYVSNTGRNASESQEGASLTSLSGSTPVTLFATPIASSGSSGTCPGSYIGYVSYTKTIASGWGWAPTSNTTIHTITDPNRTDTKIQYRGKLNDIGCDQTTSTVPDPTFSTKYRFTVYFKNNVPSNTYSIQLDGFNP